MRNIHFESVFSSKMSTFAHFHPHLLNNKNIKTLFPQKNLNPLFSKDILNPIFAYKKCFIKLNLFFTLFLGPKPRPNHQLLLQYQTVLIWMPFRRPPLSTEIELCTKKFAPFPSVLMILIPPVFMKMLPYLRLWYPFDLIWILRVKS